MAAYRQVYDSSHLQADYQEPESAPEPYVRQSSIGYLYFFTSDYLRYLRKKNQYVIHLPTPRKMHHTNLWSTKLFFIWLKVCIVLAFSVHAFSILAKCSVSYLPFPYFRFPVLAFFAPPYCDERVSIYLSVVCVFVCPRDYLRNYTSDLHQLFVCHLQPRLV